ncbi:hypothetical protein Tco_0303460 [Tanacetum coccineum]
MQISSRSITSLAWRINFHATSDIAICSSNSHGTTTMCSYLIGVEETDIREKDEKSSKSGQNRARNGKAWKSQSQVKPGKVNGQCRSRNRRILNEPTRTHLMGQVISMDAVLLLIDLCGVLYAFFVPPSSDLFETPIVRIVLYQIYLRSLTGNWFTLRVAEEMEAREAARTLEPLNENVEEQEGENGGNGNGGNGGNRNRGNGNGNRNGNHAGILKVFMPVASRVHFPRFLEVQATLIFSGTDGRCRIDRVFEKMETVVHILVLSSEVSSKICYMHTPGRAIGPESPGYAARNAKNKRRMESNLRDNRGQQPPFKRQNTNGQNVARAYTAGNNEKIGIMLGPYPY